MSHPHPPTYRVGIWLDHAGSTIPLATLSRDTGGKHDFNKPLRSAGPPRRTFFRSNNGGKLHRCTRCWRNLLIRAKPTSVLPAPVSRNWPSECRNARALSVGPPDYGKPRALFCRHVGAILCRFALSFARCERTLVAQPARVIALADDDVRSEPPAGDQ
jgi:hypothetical protein